MRRRPPKHSHAENCRRYAAYDPTRTRTKSTRHLRTAGAHDGQPWYVIGWTSEGIAAVLDGARTQEEGEAKAEQLTGCERFAFLTVERALKA